MIKVPFEQGEKVFKELVQNKTKCVVLFTGEQDKNGKNWCSDCQNIYPLYPTFLSQCKKNGLPFYVFTVGDRPTWKNPQHSFRTNKLIKINNVPTMGLFDGKKVDRKLSSDQQIKPAQQRALLFQ